MFLPQPVFGCGQPWEGHVLKQGGCPQLRQSLKELRAGGPLYSHQPEFLEGTLEGHLNDHKKTFLLLNKREET